jgi:uncharacterized protein YlaI
MTNKRLRTTTSLSPVIAEGQVTMFESVPDTGQPDPNKVYVCRECLSRRVAGPVVATVDPRWVVLTCVDCGNRVIANAIDRSNPDD